MQQIRLKLSSVRSDDLIFHCIVLTFFLLPTGTAPPLISIGLAFLIWIISGKIMQIMSIAKKAWFYPVIPFLILPWIGLLYSQNLELGMDYALKTKYWLAVFITAGVTLDQKRFRFLLWVFFASLFIGSFIALLQLLNLLPPEPDGHLGFGTVHTLACMYLNVGILMASFYFRQTNSWNIKGLLFFLFIAYVFHLAALRGRGGYLIFGLLSPIIANNLLYKFSLKLKVLASFLLIGSLLLSPVVRNVINKTMMEFSEQKERILKGENIKEFPRVFILKETVSIFLEHPVIGTGTGSIAELTQKRGQTVNHPHNNLLYMGVSYGVFGIIACLWLFLKMLKLSWNCRETDIGYFILSTGAVLFLGGMFDTQILNTGTLLFLSLGFGLLNHLQAPFTSRKII